VLGRCQLLHRNDPHARWRIHTDCMMPREAT
jgi:hypothetical protein